MQITRFVMLVLPLLLVSASALAEVGSAPSGYHSKTSAPTATQPNSSISEFDMRFAPYVLSLSLNGSYKNGLKVVPKAKREVEQRITSNYSLKLLSGPTMTAVLYQHMVEFGFANGPATFNDMLFSLRYINILRDRSHIIRWLIGAEANRGYHDGDFLEEEVGSRRFSFQPILREFGFGAVLGIELHRPLRSPLGLSLRFVPHWEFAEGGNNVPVRNPNVRIDIVFAYLSMSALLY